MTNSKIIQTYIEHGLEVSCLMTMHKGYVYLVYYQNDKFVNAEGGTYSANELDLRVETVSITPLARKPKAYEVGQKLKVLAYVGNPEGSEGEEETICVSGEIVTVVKVMRYTNSYLVTSTGGRYTFPHWALSPHIEKALREAKENNCNHDLKSICTGDKGTLFKCSKCGSCRKEREDK